MTRFKASGIHLGASLAIFVVVLGLLIVAWYPWPLFGLEGGWQGIRLVALVDIVLGPILTLILFKPGKPGLKFDMSMVVLMQIGALMYGMWNLYDARPVLLVHADDHFRPLSRTLLVETDATGRVLKDWEGMTPQRVRVELPVDPIAFLNVYRENYAKPAGLHGLADRYRPLLEDWEQLLEDAIRIEPYVARKPEWAQRLASLLRKLQRSVDELAFFPYIGRRERVFLVFDRETQDIVGVLDIPFDPAMGNPEVPRRQRTGQLESTQSEPRRSRPVEGSG